MKLANRFKDEDKIRVWSQRQYCQNCGSNQVCSLHHILGTCSDSILNSIMLCHKCHKTADGFNIGHNIESRIFQGRYLNLTLAVARDECYEYVKRDYDFEKHCVKIGIVLLL